MRNRYLLALLTFIITTTSAFADRFTVTLKVVDGHQRPVARATVGYSWEAENHVMTTIPGNSAATDAAGKAVLQIDTENTRKPLLVLSADQSLAACIGVGKKDAGKERTITLGPAIRVTGRLECRELHIIPQRAAILVFPEGFPQEGFQADIAHQQTGKSATFAFVLPAGTYTLHARADDKRRIEDARQTVTLSADHPETDLGTIDFKASILAKLQGKTPPELAITAARGVKPDVKLADFKGKWVYLEFWGFW